MYIRLIHISFWAHGRIASRIASCAGVYTTFVMLMNTWSVMLTLTSTLTSTRPRVTWSVMLTVLVLNLHHRNECRPIPGWLRIVAFEGLARLLHAPRFLFLVCRVVTVSHTDLCHIVPLSHIHLCHFVLASHIDLCHLCHLCHALTCVTLFLCHTLTCVISFLRHMSTCVTCVTCVTHWLVWHCSCVTSFPRHMSTCVTLFLCHTFTCITLFLCHIQTCVTTFLCHIFTRIRGEPEGHLCTRWQCAEAKFKRADFSTRGTGRKYQPLERLDGVGDRVCCDRGPGAPAVHVHPAARACLSHANERVRVVEDTGSLLKP